MSKRGKIEYFSASEDGGGVVVYKMWNRIACLSVWGNGTFWGIRRSKDDTVTIKLIFSRPGLVEINQDRFNKEYFKALKFISKLQ